MAEPLIIRVMREFKAALLEQDQQQMAEMSRQWLAMERELRNAFEETARQTGELRQDNRRVPVSKVIQLERYRGLLVDVRRELGKYNDYADDTISKRQAEMGLRGSENALEALKAAYQDAGFVEIGFNRLPVEVVERMVGLAGDGSPLKRLLQQSYPQAVDGLTQALIRAITLGKNPRDTARDMANGYGVGLNRSLLIARTEQLRVYREASRQQYMASGVVIGYKRLATKDTRTCAACLIADGRFYPVSNPPDEHPQGRCTMVPVVNGLPPVQWQTGRAWLEAQDSGAQRQVLGAAFDAWKEGRFDLDQLITERHDDAWGDALVTTPLVNLL